MNDSDITSRRTKLLIFGIVTFVLVVVAGSIAVNFFANMSHANVDIVNSANPNGVIDTNDYNRVKAEIRDLARAHYGLEDGEKINATIRESTYEEIGDENSKRISFLIDVENTKVTYRVWLDHINKDSYGSIALSCVAPKEAKYPESFCIGTDGHSSIDVTMEGDLPYRKMDDDGEVLYKVDHPAYEPKLILELYTKCDDKTTQEKYTKEIKEWITAYGIDAEQVSFEFDETACLVYEDNMNNAHGGHGHNH